MVNLWYAEAGANEGFPLDDRSALEIFVAERPQLIGATRTATSTSRTTPRSPRLRPSSSAAARS